MYLIVANQQIAVLRERPKRVGKHTRCSVPRPSLPIDLHTFAVREVRISARGRVLLPVRAVRFAAVRWRCVVLRRLAPILHRVHELIQD